MENNLAHSPDGVVPLQNASSPDKLIPRLDLTDAVSNPNDLDILHSLSIEVSNAMDKYGCFIIINHGVPDDVCKGIEQASKEFFDLSEDIKCEVMATADDFEGYDAGGELLYTSEETDQFIKDKPQGDTKESYQIWPSTAPFPGSTRTGPNKWPRLPCDFKEKYMAYYREMERVTALVYRILAISLGKDPYFFDKLNIDHLSVLRLLCYKDDPSVPPGGVRCSVHSDWGPLTLLRQANSDACGMYLQIVDPVGKWIDVKTNGDEILVNTGDMMDYWTNHKWRAIKHRVVQPELDHLSEPRYSFAYFHTFNAQSIADPHDFDTEADSHPVNQWEYVVRKKVGSLSSTEEAS